MTPGIISPQFGEYTVSVQDFEGPLDLLLQLIEKAELDITKVSLAQITDQYLNFLKIPGKIDAGSISAFLIIAAKLLQIKSEALLPRLAEKEEQEDLGEELVRQLLLYRKFKEISQLINQFEEKGLHTFHRIAPPPKIDHQIDLGDINLELLILAAQSVLSQSPEAAPLSTVISSPKFTIRSKIERIAVTLRGRRGCSFRDFLSKEPTRDEIVATFLAVLELFRRHYLKVIQDSIFGEIQIKAALEWDEDQPFELEFVE